MQNANNLSWWEQLQAGVNALMPGSLLINAAKAGYGTVNTAKAAYSDYQIRSTGADPLTRLSDAEYAALSDDNYGYSVQNTGLATTVEMWAKGRARTAGDVASSVADTVTSAANTAAEIFKPSSSSSASTVPFWVKTALVLSLVAATVILIRKEV